MGEPQLAVVRQVPREPQRDDRIEAQVLAEAMVDDVALATLEATLEPSDFFDRDHATIYAAMCALSERKSAVDPTTVTAELEAMGQLAAIGGRDRIGAIMARGGSGKNIEDHAKLLADFALKRRLYMAARSIAIAACDATTKADAAIEHSMTALFGAATRRASDPVSIREAIVSAAEEAIGGTEDRAAPAKGQSTGFATLDNVIAGRGFRPGRHYIIGAPPGTGKSALVGSIMVRMASRGIPVLFYSLEMTRREIADRMLCTEARVSGTRYEAGLMSEDDMSALAQAANALHALPIHIDDAKEQTITQIRAKARRHQRRHGLGLIVTDFLQLIDVPGAPDERHRIVDAMKGLTALGSELNVPVLTVASLNREAGKRSGKDRRPVVSDLLGSSRIESDAAMVAFLYRDELYNENTPDRGIAEFIIRKQRHGRWPVTVRLKFDADCARFDDLAEEPAVPAGYDMSAYRDWNGGNS